MPTDRLTRTLLALIALALFLNALNPWLLSGPAFAAQNPPADLPMMEVHLRNIDAFLNQSSNLGSIGTVLQNIERDVERIQNVVCGISNPALGGC
jgi:hypothetical protein